jgi:rRNA maturation endonuclease Nob1
MSNEEYIYRCDKCGKIWKSTIKDSTCLSCGSRNGVEFVIQYTMFEDENEK